MEVPQSVIDKAQELIKTFGEDFDYLGIFQGKHVFQFVFPEKLRTGFPFVFLFDEQTDQVEEITGMNAMELISSIYL